MATNKRPPTARKAASPRKPEPPPLTSEITLSRAFQSLILVLGVMLLFGFFFGLAWGTIAVGLLIFASAFPPVRRTVDRWLVGVSRGPEADQSAIIRMLVGAAVTLLGLIAAF